MYDTALATASCRHNIHTRDFARGSHGTSPYPDIEDVFNRSNSAVVEDDDFADIGLSNFLLAQRRIACHKLRHYRRRADVGQHGLIDRGLQDWDQDEPESIKIEMSMMYTSLVAASLMEMDKGLDRKVGCSAGTFLFWTDDPF